jgi:hypothetical protein
MIVTPVTGALALLFSRLAKYQVKAEEINAACEALGLPPALDIDLGGDIRIRLDPVYRMEGFGVVVGLPPRLSFYMHYKKDSPDHVAVGKFSVPIAFGDIAKI